MKRCEILRNDADSTCDERPLEIEKRRQFLQMGRYPKAAAGSAYNPNNSEEVIQTDEALSGAP